MREKIEELLRIKDKAKLQKAFIETLNERGERIKKVNVLMKEITD